MACCYCVGSVLMRRILWLQGRYYQLEKTLRILHINFMVDVEFVCVGLEISFCATVNYVSLVL